MVTDPLFYRLFATTPETFFLLLGMPADAAKEMAGRYQCQAIEFKETSHRADGVFLPKEPSLPLYFLEVQFYPLPSIFADLLAKVYTCLKHHDPAQAFLGVVLFASRSMEPAEVAPYRLLLEGGLIETVIIYKLARFSREEIQAMLQVHDIRETRVYREAHEEGVKEGMARAIVKLAARKMSIEEIAATLEIEKEFVREVLNGRTNGI